MRTAPTRPNHKLKSVEIEALVADYRAGATVRSLSRTFQLHEQTVRAHLERSGIEVRPQRVFSPEQIDALVGQYQAGQSLRELAARWGVAYASVRSYLLQAGVTLRPAVRPRG